VDTILQGWVGDATEDEKIRTTATEKVKEWVRARATRRMAVAGGGAGAKTTTTEAAVEAMAVAGRVDTGSATIVTTATMVTATTMTRLNVCDASTEEKERPSNPSRMHATIKSTRVAGAEECGAGAGKDLEEEKGDNTRTNNDGNRQHTTIKHNTLEEGERRRRWRRL
jgi:hypothetical protein